MRDQLEQRAVGLVGRVDLLASMLLTYYQRRARYERGRLHDGNHFRGESRLTGLWHREGP